MGTFKLVSFTNVYVDKQAPWKLKKINKERMDTVLSILIEMIKRITIMITPIMPKKSKLIFDILNMDFNKISFTDYENIPNNKFSIKKSKPIFPRYEIK